MLSLHSSITEMLVAIRGEVTMFGNRVLSIINTTQSHESGDDEDGGSNSLGKKLAGMATLQTAEISQQITGLILKLVRLHHRFLTLSEILLAETKLLDTLAGPNKKAHSRRKAQTALITGSGAAANPEGSAEDPLGAFINNKNPDGSPRVYNNLTTAQAEQAKQETAKVIARLATEAQVSPVKSYLRILLDVPTSSDEGMVINAIIVACIFLSVVLLFWETMVRLPFACSMDMLIMARVTIRRNSWNTVKAADSVWTSSAPIVSISSIPPWIPVALWWIRSVKRSLLGLGFIVLRTTASLTATISEPCTFLLAIILNDLLVLLNRHVLSFPQKFELHMCD
jgi:hypothetical protein